MEPSKPISLGRYLPDALRERPFALLFAGQVASTLGDWLFLVALPFAALELHASPAQLGIVLAARAVPFALFGLVGGAWADRFGQRRVMIGADVARLVAQAAGAALLISGAAELWMLGALAGLYGVADAFFGPAIVGLIPAAAGIERTQEANALMHTSRYATGLVGAPLGGLLVAGLGAGEAFAIDAATFAVSAACLLAMPRLRPAHAGAHESTRRAIATGWRAVRERPWLLRFLVVLLVYHLVVLPCVFVLGPLIAQRELDGATSWGVIQGAWAVGAIGGGVLAMRARVVEPMRAVGLAFAIGSLQALVIALGHTTAGIAAFLALAGIATSFGWTMWESTVQQRVPAHVVSRVISFDFTVSVGSLPLGTALIGPIAEAAGLRTTMVVASAISSTLAIGYALSASAGSRDRPAASR